MIIIRNRIIPFEGFKAINLFGILFVKGEAVLDASDIRHELIHTAQMKEMLYVFFYVWYMAEWLVKLLKYRNWFAAYLHVSFEQEAYRNQGRPPYLKERKLYAWRRFL